MITYLDVSVHSAIFFASEFGSPRPMINMLTRVCDLVGVNTVRMIFHPAGLVLQGNIAGFQFYDGVWENKLCWTTDGLGVALIVPVHKGENEVQS